MAALATLALVVQALALGEPWAPRDVVSPNGWYRAELRPAPGYERRPPELSRWRLRVLAVDGDQERELWSCAYPYDGSPRHYRLTDDGRSFAHVLEDFSDYRAVARVFRDGREAGEVTGTELFLGRSSTPRTDTGRLWLAEGGVPDAPRTLETPDGPVPLLELECLGGELRYLDLSGPRVWSDADFDELFRVRVEPELPDRLAALVTTPYVEGVSVAPWQRAGEPVRVSLAANFPTPGCRFEGFTLEQSGHEGRELVLRTWIREPVGGAVPQVLTGFRPVARLLELVPGTYRLEAPGRVATGRSPLELRVLPADALCVLRVHRPGAAWPEETLLLGRGELRNVRANGDRTDRPVPPSALERLAGLVAGLAVRSTAGRDTSASAVRLEVVHWPAGEPVVLVHPEDAAPGVLLELRRALKAFD